MPRFSRQSLAGLTIVATASAGVACTLRQHNGTQAPGKRVSVVLPRADQFPSTAGTLLAVSPDGQTIAYRAIREGTVRLFAQRINQLDSTALGDPNAQEPLFFSPNGEWVAYCTGNVLKKAPVAGGSSIAITALEGCARGGDWAANGTIVLGGNTVRTVSETGGPLTTLVVPAEGRQIWYPQFVDGGRAIVYTSSLQRPGTGVIEVFDLSTRVARALVDGAAARVVATGHLLFVRGSSLWAVKFDSARLQLTGSPVAVVDGIRVETGGAIQYAIGSGTLVYIAGLSTAESELVWVDRAGHEESLPFSRRPYLSARLSPDGTQLALQLGDAMRDIWVQRVGGQTATRLTLTAADDTDPTWTPDGRGVVFASSGASFSLMRQSADGAGEPERIVTESSVLDQASVSRDGKRIVARRVSATGDDIVMIASDGNHRIVPLIDSTFRERNPEISPDDRWIAYQSDSLGTSRYMCARFPM